MRIQFDAMEKKTFPAFYGGEGEYEAEMYVDEHNKIVRGKLSKGCSIGLHTHENTSETIFVISGEGVMLYEGEKEILRAGDCHYCPKGGTHTFKNERAEDLCFYAVVPTHP